MDLTEGDGRSVYAAQTALEAQQAVIGSLLIDGEKLSGEVMRRLRPEDFTDSTLRTLFAACREIWMELRPLDPVTLLDRVGGAYKDAIRTAMRDTVTTASWESYCRIVSDYARLGRLRDLAYRVLDCEKADEAREVLLQAQGLLAQRESIHITPFKEMAADFLNRMSDKEPKSFLDWGFPALNERLFITQGRFVVLAAESSVGKTALALQIAVGLAKSGKRVGFFSLETSQEDAADRVFANRGDVPLPAIKKRRLGLQDIQRCTRAATEDREICFELVEAAGCTVEDIRATTLMRQYDVIFADYVQLIQAKGVQPSDQVRAVSMGLHTLALQLGCTVVGLSQVTPPPKNQKGERPELSKENLRESHQLIHDAEAILIMDLTDLKDYGSNRVLKVDKNKDGPCARMILHFDAKYMRFDYVPPYEDPDAAAARERNEKMDANREARRAKEAAAKAPAIQGQASFAELPEGSSEGSPW